MDIFGKEGGASDEQVEKELQEFQQEHLETGSTIAQLRAIQNHIILAQRAASDQKEVAFWEPLLISSFDAWFRLVRPSFYK